MTITNNSRYYLVGITQFVKAVDSNIYPINRTYFKNKQYILRMIKSIGGWMCLRQPEKATNSNEVM